MADSTLLEPTSHTQATVVLIACQSALFGYFLLELAYYFQRFPNDRTGFRILVCWLAALELGYYAVRLAGAFHSLDAKLRGALDVGMPPGLGLASIALTTCVESTTEGFYVWRLWRVTKRVWMRAISCTLWLFSTTAHIVWIGIAARDGRASLVAEPAQLLIIQLAFWGTFAEGIFVATSLLYELQFANDRKAIKPSSNSTVSQLVSLAMRTSSILVVFELVVAIAVSVRSQPSFALVAEVEYAAGLYTILAAIVTLYTLNFRSILRAAPPPAVSAPTLRTVTSSSSGFNGGAPRIRSPSTGDALGDAIRQNKANGVGGAGGGGGGDRRAKKRSKDGFKDAFGLTGSVGRLTGRLEERFGTSSSGSGRSARGRKSGSGGSGSTSGGGGGGGAGGRSRGSALAGGISVSQTISHVEEISQVPLEEFGGVTEEGFLSPAGWRTRASRLHDDERPFPPNSS